MRKPIVRRFQEPIGESIVLDRDVGDVVFLVGESRPLTIAGWKSAGEVELRHADRTITVHDVDLVEWEDEGA